ncbi:hypothetical protein PGH07_01225 [Sulfurovum sp. zt1-1]|uniref:Uncharacterized protein n=1 Tax=Sulfurovum zhangzhouensis TaxID=3019067 RepID=A0ABT7QVH9_9BACT|nr:hypothetical protein [Sulfurovum zhangzhouensis]MDM5270793.1 hypothetical protein [Sulfurovum zhangzhouensis]
MYEKLNKYFIGFTISEYDYERVYRMLPTPSIESYEYADGGTTQKKVLIYTLDSYITSAKQFRWIASIKHAIQARIKCDIKWIDEYFVEDKSLINVVVYDLKYLSDMFDAKRIVYPTPLYPSEKKSVYRNLCMIATKLYKKDILYKELLLGIAIDFNNKFTGTQRYSHRKLYAKVIRCIQFISIQNPSVLKGVELKNAYKKGGAVRAKQVQKAKNTNIHILKTLLQDPKYTKSNGTPNIKLLAKKMGKTRQTIANYLKNVN